MKSKLNNLISQEDFKANWRAEQAKKTKRTETGLDILKEGVVGDKYPLSDNPDEPGDLSTGRVEDGPGVEEIIPEGLPDDNIDAENIDFNSLPENTIDEIVDYLREVLLDMEQQGIIDDSTTDDIDEKADGDWLDWIQLALELEDLPGEVYDAIGDIATRWNEEGDEKIVDDEEDDVECPDCDGTGYYDDGEECERDRAERERAPRP